ncbi:ExbD/TolR family protein [Pontibacter sp. MBLB2868]|uniref:ExbD/TolR family protein n=1 Tax=Pontibacter sp. MBLB2868 TaxID=3451555 RepID=UPI003F755DB2
MAQLQENNTTGKGGKKRAKKKFFHLDMTPMVDLAFLLLTFFMLTTTFSKLQTMELHMPLDPKGPIDEAPIAGKNALTVILGEQNEVYYYFGFAGDKPAVVKTDFSATGIRKVLVSEKIKSNRKMVVLIKAMKKSRYSNLVDLLDEIKITDTKKYALVDLDKTDKDLLASL